MNPIIKRLGEKVLNVVCKPHVLQECMRTFAWPIYTMEPIENVYLNEIKNVNAVCGGHVDFLKVGREGGKRSIKPPVLAGIRRIEGGIKNGRPWEYVLFHRHAKTAGYTIEVEKRRSYYDIQCYSHDRMMEDIK